MRVENVQVDTMEFINEMKLCFQARSDRLNYSILCGGVRRKQGNIPRHPHQKGKRDTIRRTCFVLFGSYNSSFYKVGIFKKLLKIFTAIIVKTTAFNHLLKLRFGYPFNLGNFAFL